MEQRIYDAVILGGGPAGYTAALYAARSGLDTLVLEQLSAGGQMALTEQIDNYPGFPEGVDGFTLGELMQQGAERFGAQTVLAQVEGADLYQPIKKIYTSDGTFLTRTVLIATGANPRSLGVEGEETYAGSSLHYCATCDGRAYKDKIVVVVGGGNSAVADALVLSRLAKEVHLIHRRDTLRATKLYHTALEQAGNVTIHWNSTVSALNGEDRLQSVTLKNLKDDTETELICHGLFVSIGRIPATQMFQGQLTMDKGGYLMADETTATNLPGVFAVGDVRTKPLRQVVTAVADGAVAATAAEEYLSHQAR